MRKNFAIAPGLPLQCASARLAFLLIIASAQVVRCDDLPEKTTQSPQIIVNDCLTRFPYRRRLASERTGVLRSVPEEGDRFEPGEVVASLRDDVPKAALAVAELRAENDSEVRSAAKAHELANFSYTKMKTANERRPGTFEPDEVQRRELEEATTALQVEVAEHAYDVAQKELNRERAELESYLIRTDRGGIVTRVVKKDGEGVQASEEVVELVDVKTVRVEGYASSDFLAVLKKGMPVLVILAIPTPTGELYEADFEGELGFVDVSLTSGQEIRVWADIANSSELIAEGLPARMVIFPAGDDDRPGE